MEGTRFHCPRHCESFKRVPTKATFPYLFDKEFEMGEINPEVGFFHDYPECCTL
jgi:hypothetical protein